MSVGRTTKVKGIFTFVVLPTDILATQREPNNSENCWLFLLFPNWRRNASQTIRRIVGCSCCFRIGDATRAKQFEELLAVPAVSELATQREPNNSENCWLFPLFLRIGDATRAKQFGELLAVIDSVNMIKCLNSHRR